ncbi:MAG TPA: peptidylprolyl isomerase [Polyangiaceae bacterium]|nr:peptidylprolyl isomerase [Polyangiaceae bacterium]
MQIGPNVFAEVDYVLSDEDGEVLDDSSADDGEPLRYVHGYGMLVPGLEKRLVGLAAGDAIDVVVPPEEAYGLHDDELVYAIDRSEAPTASEGDEVVLEDEDGDEAVAHVVEVGDEEIVVDGNHPLAGLTLRYRLNVREVREATPDEIASAAKAFEEVDERSQPKDELVSLFSLNRNRKPDPPS